MSQIIRFSLSFLFLLLLTLTYTLAGWANQKDLNDLLDLKAEKTSHLAKSAMMDIALAGDRVVAVGELGRIAFSDDHGESWSQAEVPLSVTLTAVDFPTPTRGWAVGHDGVILHSKDSGETWQLQLDGNQVNSIVIEQVNSLLEQMDDRIAAATDDKRTELEYQREDLEFFRSDAEMAAREGATRPFMDLWFQDEQYGIVVGSFGMIFRTNDGGAHWEPLIDRMDNPDGFHYYGITKSGSSLFIAGEVGLLFRSADNGDSWQRLESPYEGSFFGVNGHPDGGFLMIYGLGGNSYVSHDAGDTWSRVDKPKTSALSASTVTTTGNILMASYDGIIMQSQDKGLSFVPLDGRFSKCIAMQPINDGEMLLVGLDGIKKYQLASQTGRE